MRTKEKKNPAGLTSEFLEEVDSAGADAIKAKIILTQKGIEESKVFKKENPGVIEAREAYQLVLQPINEAIKVGGNRVKYLYQRLKDLGEP